MNMLNCGFAKTDITPPLGMPLEGFNLPNPAQSVHDPLFASAVYLDDGSTQLVIVGVDLLLMDRQDMDRIKGFLARNLNLLPHQILINFTHTHCGPRIGRWSYSGEPNPHYLAQLENALLSIIQRAMSCTAPVTLEAGMTETDIPLSRRKLDEQGKAEFGPYPPGPTCNHLPFGVFRNQDGTVAALLFSVSCHPTISHEPVYSAEYPGAAVRCINQALDIDNAVFLQGAGGDTKPSVLNIDDHHFSSGSWEMVEATGRKVAEAVLRALEKGGYHTVTPQLHACLAETRLPLQTPPARDSLLEMAKNGSNEYRKSWAEDMLAILEISGSLPNTVPVQVHHIQLAEGLNLVGLEGELASELGNMIIETVPGITFPLGYTNGSRINIPCDRQLPEGGYGVDSAWEYHWPANLAPGIDATIRQTLQSMGL